MKKEIMKAIQTPIGIVWQKDNEKLDWEIQGEHCLYSDRLFQWDSSKYNQLSQKHFGNQGQAFWGRSHETIEAFICEYIGEPIKLNYVHEMKNQSTGYPLWRFDYDKPTPQSP